MGCHSLLQGIFPTQGSNVHLLLAGGFLTTEPPGSPASVRVHAYIYNNYPVVILSGLFINSVSPTHQGPSVQNSYYQRPRFTDEDSESLRANESTPQGCPAWALRKCSLAKACGTERQPTHCSQAPPWAECDRCCGTGVILIHTKELRRDC